MGAAIPFASKRKAVECMSAADVKYWTLSHYPARSGQEQRFAFRCPKHKDSWCGDLLIAGTTEIKRNGQNQDGGVAQWEWDGDRDNPTFQPSINCQGCWHGYIENGRCVSVNKTDEPEPIK